MRTVEDAGPYNVDFRHESGFVGRDVLDAPLGSPCQGSWILRSKKTEG